METDEDSQLGIEIDWYLDELRVTKGASFNTVSNYARDLKRYQDYLAEEEICAWGQVQRSNIERFLLALAKGSEQRKPLAVSSRARTLASVRSFHRWLNTQRLVAGDPAAAVKPPRPSDRLPTALSVFEVEKLLAAAEMGEDTRAWRDSAVLEFLYATGARVSEAVDVVLDDVDLSDEFSVVRLFGKGRKERLVPLGSYARAAIERYLVRARPALNARSTGQTKLFLNLRGKPLSRQSVWELIQRTAQQAGLNENVSPHTLRHSFATHMLEGGASIREVQELLGHASVTTTQIYTRMTAANLREVYLTTHPRALG